MRCAERYSHQLQIELHSRLSQGRQQAPGFVKEEGIVVSTCCVAEREVLRG
jgi:hypothetical protein